MWRTFVRFGQYFYQVIMPARFRRAAMERYTTKYLEKGVDKWQHPDQLAEMAADDAAKEAAKTEQKRSAGEQAVQEGAAETGQAPVEGEAQPKKSIFWLIVRWILHIFLVLLVLVGLYYLNWWFGLERVLRSPWPWLHPYWLPILFFIIYIMFWLGGWLWSLTGPERVGDDYPDLQQAWELAIATLYRSGIEIRQAPVFLVLGRTEAPPNQLFGVTLRLRISAPQGNVLPLRIYASQDRVFITCPGASVLARQSRMLAQRSYEEFISGQDRAGQDDGTALEGAGGNGAPSVGQALGQAASEALGIEPITATATAEPMAPAAQVQPQAATEVQEADLEPWSEEDRRVLGLMQSEGTGARTRKLAASFLKDPAEVRVLTSRLRYVCRLLRRDRAPYCPINGILVLVPHAALQDDVDASQTGTACRHDLAIIRHTLQVQCPTFAMVCDMEQSDGFRQFLDRLPARHNINRLGQRFPLFPDVDERQIPRLVETGTSWMANALLPSLVYNLFRVETPGSTRGPALNANDALEGNTRLYEFLWEMRDQRQRLARLLTRGLMLDGPRAFYFGGVYLAGTGQNASAFSSGVFLRLLQSQNFVSWTSQAMAAEQRYRGWAWFLFVLNIVLLIGGPILAYIFWPW